MAFDQQIRVGITGDGVQLANALNTAGAQIQSFGSKAVASLSKVSMQLKLLGAAGTIGAGRWLRGTIDAWDDLYKASQKTGVAVDQLAKLRYAAQLADVDAEKLGQALKFLNQTLGEAAQGSKPAIEALSALGIAVGDDVYTAFLKAADSISQLQDPAERAARLSAVFKKSWDGLVPLLNDGAGAIRAAADELERMGGVPTEKAAREAQNFNDNIDRLSTALRGPFNEALMAALPTIESISASFVRASQSSEGFADSLAKMAFFGTGKEGLQRELAYQYQTLEDFRAKLAELRRQEAAGEFPLFGGTEKLYSQIQEYERTIVEIRQRIADNLQAQKEIDLQVKVTLPPEAPTTLTQAAVAASRAAQAAVPPIIVPLAISPMGAVGSYADLQQEFLRQQIPGNAAGGMIRGPGTGTSDSILSWLSNGEYVVRSAAVQHYGADMFRAINNMALPRFAGGGEVSAEAERFSIQLGGGAYTAQIAPDVGSALRRELKREIARRGTR